MISVVTIPNALSRLNFGLIFRAERTIGVGPHKFKQIRKTKKLKLTTKDIPISYGPSSLNGLVATSKCQPLVNHVPLITNLGDFCEAATG